MKILKFAILLTICLRSVASFAAVNDTLKVLFIGNSYTYFNNLPKIFSDLSESGGKMVMVNYSAYPSYWLEDHTNNSNTLNKITERIWDFVVLQEQSQVPTIDFYRYHSMYYAATSLDYLITTQGSNTVFFMTWGRKYGGRQTIGNYSSPLFIDFFHMQDSLRSAYEEIANILSATVSPVGLAWGKAFMLNPAVDLWQEDDSHPTFKGSYLAACVFYAVLYNESPVGVTYTGGLNVDAATFLQTVAYQTVTSVKPKKIIKPSLFKLYQNYPNPFNPITTIEFYIPKSDFVTLKVYNILGEEVANLVSEEMAAGNYKYNWDAGSLASGVYVYKFQTSVYVETKKMILLR